MFSGHKNNAILVVGYLQEISEAHAHLGIYQLPLKLGFAKIEQSRRGFIKGTIY